MTELIIKGIDDRRKLDSIINFLKSWDVDVEVKTKRKKKTDKRDLFENSFGIWAEREIDLKEIRKQNRERRTEKYNKVEQP